MAVRTLKMTSPAMRGTDVERFQTDINAELARWDVPHAVAVDGVYGAETRDTARSVCYGLGLQTPVMDNGATPAIRVKVRHRKLTPAELARYRSRADWRKRLARRYGAPDAAILASVAFARSMVGVSENPPGSNSGPRITDWCRRCGVGPAPWCGCFANAVLEAGGFDPQEWLRYCPWIEANARSGDSGWSWHQIPKVGDLVLYGASIAQHVGFVTEADGSFHGDTETVEGNTSNGPGGSQSNGGCVAIRHRHQDGSLSGFPIRGYARPPWRKVEA